MHQMSHKRAPPKMIENQVNEKKKAKKDERCHFCRKIGHFQKDCPKRKEWFEKKGIPYDPEHKLKWKLFTYGKSRQGAG
ncbi:hypothetical protein N665_0022s0025 [Sinapis alba]|nr:hypothetical protein N665_0022s0025 [Sinapis alba]